MCKITSKIKFCTCKATSTERLQHYWCLHRYSKVQKDSVNLTSSEMGNKAMTLDYEVNKVVLEQRLKDADAFERDLRFKPKDVLEIVCHNTDANKRTVYGFKYKGNGWQVHAISALELRNEYDEVVFGKMKN